MRHNNPKMMDINETPGDVHGRGWCLIFRCERIVAILMHFVRMNMLLPWIPSISARVKSHLFSFSFYRCRRHRRCTAVQDRFN